MKLGSPINSSYILKKLFGLASSDLLDAPPERITLGSYTKAEAVRVLAAIMVLRNTIAVVFTTHTVPCILSFKPSHLLEQRYINLSMSCYLQ